jgi:serine/threonine-protein kinase
VAARLGQGGAGEVWSATHLLTGRDVAIKRLLVSRYGEAPSEVRARFVLEARSACAVDHPNVVQVLDFVEQDGEPPFLVMELLQGETLADQLARQGALSPEEAAAIVLPVVSAVGAAHARGIVHRDLKPSNIFLSKGPGNASLVKVLDFGIAKWSQASGETPSPRTQTGSTLGTPSYMSPEQATAERAVDHRTDIWSIGVILYECLSGVRPLEGENAAQMVMRLLSTGIIPLEHLVHGLPKTLGELVGRMLARDPRHRPDDLSEVFTVLQGLAALPVPSFGKARAILENEATTWSPITPASSRRGERNFGRGALRSSPRRWSLGGLLVAAGALVAALLAFWLDGRPSEVAPAALTVVPVIAPPPNSTSPEASAASTQAPQPAAPPLERAPVQPEPATEQPRVREQKGMTPPRRLVSRREIEAPAPSLQSNRDKPTVEASALPPGAECEHSRECQSRVCLAFACQ